MDLHTTVTSILVTGKTADRFKLAQRAVQSWQRQLYNSRHEMLIINDHPSVSLFPGGPPTGIREIRVPHRLSLGALRNIGIDNARTEYLIQWDDDDYSRHTRLTWQIEQTVKGRASMFRYEVHCDLDVDRHVFVSDGQEIKGGGFPGTMLWPRSAPCRFKEIGKGEDTDFVWQLRKTCGIDVLLNDPTLYCRFYHGANTWSKGHIMRFKPGSRRLTETEHEYVQNLVMQTRGQVRELPSVKTP